MQFYLVKQNSSLSQHICPALGCGATKKGHKWTQPLWDQPSWASPAPGINEIMSLTWSWDLPPTDTSPGKRVRLNRKLQLFYSLCHPWTPDKPFTPQCLVICSKIWKGNVYKLTTAFLAMKTTSAWGQSHCKDVLFLKLGTVRSSWRSN